MTAASPTRLALRPIPDAEILSFLYLEARLADEGRYSEWEALWANDDDRVEYRVPMHPDDNPRTTLAYINDNRRRIGWLNSIPAIGTRRHRRRYCAGCCPTRRSSRKTATP